MYITNLDDLIITLRGKLKEYLTLKLKKEIFENKQFHCFAHEDGNNPNMGLNPKTQYETVKCFSCGFYGDIFDAANKIEDLPSHGPEWASITIPKLCDLLDISYNLGELTALDKQRIELHQIAQDLSGILCNQASQENEYCKNRNWIQPFLTANCLSEELLIKELEEKGWKKDTILASGLIKHNVISFFGKNLITFTIHDHTNRPLGFVARNLDPSKHYKYINSPESLIYKKNSSLLGINIALKEAKQKGLYVVEGPGDLCQLYRLGIKNAVALCGVAFTESHLLYLKSLNIRKIFLNFDWDNSGNNATQKILENALGNTSGINTHIVLSPQESSPEEEVPYYKDPDEFLKDTDEPKKYLDLVKLTAFQWQLKNLSDNETPESICTKMIPIIASEDAAIKRELLVRDLSVYCGITEESINQDVDSLRNNKYSEKAERIETLAKQYVREVVSDPENIRSHMNNHEQEIELVEKEYKNTSMGVNYQLSRVEILQQQRIDGDDDPTSTIFKMNNFKAFEKAMSGGQKLTEGCLVYVGGRPNSGKTAVLLNIATDIAFSDPNTTVIIHITDDSYVQIEPRIKTNLYKMAHPAGVELTIGMIVQPVVNLKNADNEYWDAYHEANRLFRELILEERLIIVDAEDGTTLATTEKNIKYYKKRYPSRKMLCVVDNTHNLMDFPSLDQTTRITMISNSQKRLTTKYRLCMMATAEYRKNMPKDPSKFLLPVDDDLADARAMMYRPNIIFHVYNDLHDRKEHAEIFWRKEDNTICPRLLLVFTKNKITSFKEKLVLDLDPITVTLSQKSETLALAESSSFIGLKETEEAKIVGTKMVYSTQRANSDNTKASTYTTTLNNPIEET